MRVGKVWMALLGVACLTGGSRAAADGADALRTAAVAGDWKQVQAMGPGVLPALARLYAQSSTEERTRIAYVFYQLGWKSPEAKRALIADVRTPDTGLRLQVQWALGRVSDDPDVVDVLLRNMRDDPVPLFRDKAACALAYDQIHLAPAQKVRLFEGLVLGLSDEKPQVRAISAQALRILTGQSKGLEEWKRWVAEYRAHQ